MGFSLPEEVTAQLGGFVQSMCDAQYLELAEAEKIPSVPRQSTGNVYGPLGDVPNDPDLVLLWLTPGQAMIFNAAAGTASWTSTPMDVSGPRVHRTGAGGAERPTVAVLPTCVAMCPICE